MLPQFSENMPPEVEVAEKLHAAYMAGDATALKLVGDEIDFDVVHQFARDMIGKGHSAVKFSDAVADACDAAVSFHGAAGVYDALQRGE